MTSTIIVEYYTPTLSLHYALFQRIKLIFLLNRQLYITYSTTYTLLFETAVCNSSNSTTQLLLNDEDWKDMRQNRMREKRG